MQDSGQRPEEFLQQHMQNAKALMSNHLPRAMEGSPSGHLFISEHVTASGQVILILTEDQPSITTMLLSEEF